MPAERLLALTFSWSGEKLLEMWSQVTGGVTVAVKKEALRFLMKMAGPGGKKGAVSRSESGKAKAQPVAAHELGVEEGVWKLGMGESAAENAPASSVGPG